MLSTIIQLFKDRRPRRFHGECQRCGQVDYLPWATEHGVRYCGHCWERDALAYANGLLTEEQMIEMAEAMFRSEWPKNDWEKTRWVHQRYLNLARTAAGAVEQATNKS